MCGINGITRGGEKEKVANMNKHTKRRGPEGSYVWSNGVVTLGHNLLSTMGSPNLSQQPMLYKESAIIFNGAIFNWKQIDEWNCSVDTELLIKGLYYYGLDFLDRCEGMWAFAWYKNKNIVLCRDRFGIKPLFYRAIKGDIIFSSSPHALDINSYRLNKFGFGLLRQFGYVPGYLTILEGVYKLVPGEIINYNLTTHKSSTSSLWKKSFEQTEWSREQFLFKLEAAVKTSSETSRQRGIFLSGGLDSGSILHFLGEKRTYSTKFEACHLEHRKSHYLKKINEDAMHAERLAKDYNLSHETLTIKYDKFITNIRETVKALELPTLFKHHPAYFLANKYMREKGTIITYSGDGGDEMYSGYNVHTNYLGDRGTCPFSCFYEGKSIRKDLRIRLIDEPTNLISKSSYVDYMKSWFPTQIFGSDFFNNCLAIEMLTHVSDEFMSRNDRFGSYYGMEGRFPLLNKELYYYVMGISSKIKIKNLNPKRFSDCQYKYIARKSLKGILPDYIINKKKSGWSSPSGLWAHANIEKTPIDESLERLIKWPESQSKLELHILELREWFAMHSIGIEPYKKRS